MISKNSDQSEYHCSFKNILDSKKFSSGILSDYELSGSDKKTPKALFAHDQYFRVKLTQEETKKLFYDLSKEIKSPEGLKILNRVRLIQFCDDFKKKNLNSPIPEIKDFYSTANVDPNYDHLLIMHILEHVFEKVDESLKKGSSQRDLYIKLLDENLESILSDFLNKNKDIPEFSKVKSFITQSKLAKYYNDHVIHEERNVCEKLIAKHEESHTPKPIFVKNAISFPVLPVSSNSHIPQIPTSLQPSIMQNTGNTRLPIPTSFSLESIESKKALASLIKEGFKLNENCMILKKSESFNFYFSFKNEKNAKIFIDKIISYGILNKDIIKKIHSEGTISFFDTCFFEISLTENECNTLCSHLLSDMKIPQDLNLVDQEKLILFHRNFEQKKLNRQDSKTPETEEFFKRANVDPVKDHLLIMYILESTLKSIGEKFSTSSTVYITYRKWVNITCKAIVEEFVKNNNHPDALVKMQNFMKNNDLVHFDVKFDCLKLLNNSETNILKPS